MSTRFEELVIQAFRDLKEDVKVLDSKMDDSQSIHIRNTAVLEEHERRSTASEGRLAILEQRQQEMEQQANRVRGFFIYGSALIGTLGGILAFLSTNDTFKSILTHLLTK